MDNSQLSSIYKRIDSLNSKLNQMYDLIQERISIVEDTTTINGTVIFLKGNLNEILGDLNVNSSNIYMKSSNFIVESPIKINGAQENTENLLCDKIITATEGFSGYLLNRGKIDALSGTDKGLSGLSIHEAYNNGYPITYGNVIHITGNGGGELLLGWTADDSTGNLYYRSIRDISNSWSSWKRIVFETDTFKGTLLGNSDTTYQVNKTVPAGSTAELIHSQMADNDFFRILTGGESNSGYAEIATADDGTEPIYIRQYSGQFANLLRSITLLDASGNSQFPGVITAPNFEGTASQISTSASGCWNNNGTWNPLSKTLIKGEHTTNGGDLSLSDSADGKANLSIDGFFYECDRSGGNEGIKKCVSEDGNTWDISISGNSSTSSVASKLGTADVGSLTKPTFIEKGEAKVCDDTLDVNISGNSGTCTSPFPIGAIYLQLKGQQSPSELFGGTWSNVSDSFAGEFFRVEGGNAADFGESQDQSIQTHRHSIGNEDSSHRLAGLTSGGSRIMSREGSGGSVWYTDYEGSDETRPVNSTIRVWKRIE